MGVYLGVGTLALIFFRVRSVQLTDTYLAISEGVLRGLQAALTWVFGFGLEKFLPCKKLEPGQDIPLELDPPSVEDRPHITCAPWRVP